MKFWAVTIKDLKIILTDRGALISLFALPLMFITVMSLVLGPLFRGPDDAAIQLPVVILDHSAQADALVADLKEIGGLTLETTLAENNSTRAMTRAEAEKLLREGRRVAALIVPEGFGNAISRGETANVILLQDPAQQNLANIVASAVNGVLGKISGQAQAARGVDQLTQFVQSKIPNGAFDAAQFKTRAQQAMNDATHTALIQIHTQSIAETANAQPGVFEQNVPGFSVMFVFFLVSYVASSILTEKQDGTFRRLLVAPISKPALLAGKLAPNFIVGVLQVTIMFAIGHFFFGMKIGNDLFGLALVTIAVALAATGLGILVAALAKSERQISGLGTLVILTLAALGGSMVPLSVMPDVMQNVAKITPHAWAMMAYQNLIVRGYTWVDVLPQVAMLLGFALVFYAIALWRFRFD